MVRRLWIPTLLAAIFTVLALSAGPAASAQSRSASSATGTIQSYGDTDKWASSVNETTGLVTIAHPDVASDVGFAEGGGYDESTGKTWILGDTCRLFTLDTATGQTTLRFDLRSLTTPAGILPLQWCGGFADEDNGTAYISAWKWDETDPANAVLVDTYLFKINLTTGAVVGQVATLAKAPGTNRTIFGIAVDPFSGNVYGAIAETKQIVRIDIYSGAISVVATLANTAWDLAFDPSGLLWFTTDSPSYSLASVDVQANDIAATEHVVGELLTSDGEHYTSEALWFGKAYTPSPASDSTATLPNTGQDSGRAAVGILAGLGLLSGALLSYVSRRRTR